jgi:predicted RNase H-like HicB family nuclease
MWSFFRRPAPVEHRVTLRIEIEREADGRYLADVVELPGVMAYAKSEEEALSKVAALAFRVIAERLEHNEDLPQAQQLSMPISVSFQPA